MHGQVTTERIGKMPIIYNAGRLENNIILSASEKRPKKWYRLLVLGVAGQTWWTKWTLWTGRIISRAPDSQKNRNRDGRAYFFKPACPSIRRKQQPLYINFRIYYQSTFCFFERFFSQKKVPSLGISSPFKAPPIPVFFLRLIRRSDRSDRST